MPDGLRQVFYTYWRAAVLGVVLIVLSFVLVPSGRLDGRWRAALLAFVCGALVGTSEIVTRYRDEPLNALLRSPFGPIYVAVNGYLSFLATLIIARYPGQFPSVANDQLLVGVAAGFGASVVMRTRLAVIKGSDNRDISIGPDAVITGLLQMVDKNIDRFRAARRQALVVQLMPPMRTLGDFPTAARYLLASLLAFQNLDENLKTQLNAIVKDYEAQSLPPDIKYMALGFVFLTIVGEKHYQAVLTNALALSGKTATAPAAPPPSPA
jgi:hypothetical protein